MMTDEEYRKFGEIRMINGRYCDTCAWGTYQHNKEKHETYCSLTHEWKDDCDYCGSHCFEYEM